MVTRTQARRDRGDLDLEADGARGEDPRHGSTAADPGGRQDLAGGDGRGGVGTHGLPGRRERSRWGGRGIDGRRRDVVGPDDVGWA